MKTGESYLRDADVVIHASVGDVKLFHVYASNDDAWSLEGPNGDASLLRLLPKPFGSSPYRDGSLRWWHNYFSFVLAAKTNSPGLYVRDTDGHMTAYKATYDATSLSLDPCNKQSHCFVTPATGGEYQDEMLEFFQGGAPGPLGEADKYVLWRKTGERLEFTKRWLRNQADIYFLEHVYSAQGDLVATVDYDDSAPSTLPENNCAQPYPPPVWFECKSGAPFVRQVVAASGAKLVFNYQDMPYSVPAPDSCSRDERVLTEVDLADPGGSSSTWVVKYHYRDGNAGELESIETPSASSDSGSQFLRIQYQNNGARVFHVTRETQNASELVIDHQYESSDPNSKVNQASSSAEILKVTANPAGGVSTSYDTGFDGFGGTATLSELNNVSKFPGQLDGTWTDTTTGCSPAEACSEGLDQQTRDQTTGWVQDVVDKAEHKTHYDYKRESDWSYESAVTVSNPGAANAPSPATTNYPFDANNKQLHRAASTTKASLFSGETGVYYTYDGQGRVTREVHSGSTAVDLGLVGQKFIATFYTYQAPNSTSADQKYLMVTGPCEVASLDSTACANAAGAPVTETIYFAKDDSKGRGNQPKELHRYPNGSNAPALVSSIDDYDLLGNVLQQTDENGHSTVFEYLPGTHLVSKRTVATDSGPEVTEYGYELGRRIWTKLPPSQGGSPGYELECYRENTSTGSCIGGTVTDVIQWKAKAGDYLGLSVSEKVVYDYWTDPSGLVKQSLKSEAFYSPGGLRRVKKYGADLHRRQVREASGGSLTDPLAAEFQTVKAYDHADHVKALGLPYNDPPKYCESASGSLSTACNALAYDDVDRLQSVTEYPDGASPVTTCFDRDAHGNISRIAFGCATDCASCLNEGPKVASYAYDDFGNVITASLPNTGTTSAKGELRFVYDASGHVTKRDLPSLRDSNTYYETSYDGLGRVLGVTSKSTAGGNAVGLWTAAYDQAIAPCSSGTNTVGRLAQRADSFGTTCYSYDAEGRITKEERQRATPTCDNKCINDTLTTEYTYDLAGNLTSIVYPHGRKVWYDYYSDSGRENRIKAVRVSLPGSGDAGREILRNIVWEPYGSLSSYSVVNPDDDSEAKVEYLLGDAGNRDATATQNCGYGRPATNDNSGRLRALWVSKAGDGDLYRRAYTWKADQIVGQDTCVASNDAAVSANRERFGYDHALRLTGAEEVGLGTRSYSYDARGNRTSEANWARTMTSALGGDALPDQLQSVSAPPTKGEDWSLNYTYDYDADGRVKAIHSPPYLTPSPSGLTDVKMEFGYGDPTVGGIDAVFSAVTLSNAFDGGPTYNYYYDAQSRRWRKVYPTLKADEFFYDLGHLLLEDRGNDALDSQTPVYPIDEYVWLDGRPVAYLRSNFDASWNRLNDLTGSCKRNGEEAACGLYFLVTDHIGKPAVVLDPQHRISGAAVEGDPFGEANSRPLAGDTHHPMAAGDAGPIATIDLGPSRGLEQQVRVKFAMLDVPAEAVGFVDQPFQGAFFLFVFRNASKRAVET